MEGEWDGKIRVVRWRGQSYRKRRRERTSGLDRKEYGLVGVLGRGGIEGGEVKGRWVWRKGIRQVGSVREERGRVTDGGGGEGLWISLLLLTKRPPSPQPSLTLPLPLLIPPPCRPPLPPRPSLLSQLLSACQLSQPPPLL